MTMHPTFDDHLGGALPRTPGYFWTENAGGTSPAGENR
jgi:hypothetical protein